MSDLVKRLRKYANMPYSGPIHDTCGEAADEIEMLWDQLKDAERRETEAERRCERLRGAGQAIIDSWDERDDAMPLHRAMDALAKALEKDDE